MIHQTLKLIHVCQERILTVPFNSMRTLKFKAQPTNTFFTIVNQMFGGSSQLPTTAEHVVIKSNR